MLGAAATLVVACDVGGAELAEAGRATAVETVRAKATPSGARARASLGFRGEPLMFILALWTMGGPRPPVRGLAADIDARPAWSAGSAWRVRMGRSQSGSVPVNAFGR